MNRFGALAGGVVAGSIGALIWAAIAYFTGYEVGWVAWGVGGLVGSRLPLLALPGPLSPKKEKARRCKHSGKSRQGDFEGTHLCTPETGCRGIRPVGDNKAQSSLRTYGR